MALKFDCRLWLRLAIFAGAISASASALSAEEAATGFVSRVYRDSDGEHKYMVFIPAAYRADQKWPVLLYLHGSGSRGSDGKLPLVAGIGAQIQARASTLPLIVVFPQCEDVECRAAEGWRAASPDARRALAILEEVERDYSVDKQREILSGLSMGGFGTWEIAAENPGRWSAIVPLAGLGDVSKARKFKNLPVWAFHGSKDVEVKPDEQRRMIEAVRDAGGRAYFTLLPEVRHNIINVVFGDDALYEWMLHPQTEPRPQTIIKAAKAPAKKPKADVDFLPPFLPGVEVPQAMYVHLDPQTIEALCYALPDLVPPDALSAAGENIYQSRRGVVGRLWITLAGINYRGTLERAIVTTEDDGWITITLGLRDLIAEIGSTTVRGSLMAASAGPMDIVIGQPRPVWLSFDVRPTLADKKVKFEIGQRRFAIPDDAYAVTMPQVGVAAPTPMLRRRIANTVSTQLVQGAYGRKTEIEQRVIDAVPGLVQRLEQGLEKSLSETREISGWPIPALKPRFRLSVGSLRVNKSGISMILGAVFADAGLNPKAHPVRRIERPAVKLETLAETRGLTLGFSDAFVEGLTQSVIDSGAAYINANDISVKEFGAFGEIDQVAKAVPDLLRYGDSLRMRTRFRAVDPLVCKVVEQAGASHASESGEKTRTGTPKCAVQIGLPHFVLSVDIKTLPHQSSWQTCAEFDLTAMQEFNLSVGERAFAGRTFRFKKRSPEVIDVTGRFADGYLASNPTLHPEVIAGLLRTAWDAAGKLEVVDEITMNDRLIGTANLRLDQMKAVGPFISLSYVPAATRITNASSEPILYEVRGPQSAWGGPFTLEPNESSDFAVPYPITLRRTIVNQEEIQTLRMGSHVVFGRVGNTEADPTDVATQPDGKALRN
jgi:poly(3-hydroxybutyrate) depolymerase